MPRLDISVIRQQISHLLAVYPELANDEMLRLDMIEGETDAISFLNELLRRVENTTILINGIYALMSDHSARMKRLNRRVDALRELMLGIMQAADLKRVEMPNATIALRAVPPHIIITDDALLPMSATRVTITPDKAKIKELMKDGPVPGAVLSNGGTTISITTK